MVDLQKKINPNNPTNKTAGFQLAVATTLPLVLQPEPLEWFNHQCQWFQDRPPLIDRRLF